MKPLMFSYYSFHLRLFKTLFSYRKTSQGPKIPAVHWARQTFLGGLQTDMQKEANVALGTFWLYKVAIFVCDEMISLKNVLRRTFFLLHCLQVC